MPEKTYRIVTLAGDGIGPEVMTATEQVLAAVTRRLPGLKLDLWPREVGADLYRRTGVALPSAVVEDCRQADATLLVAIGLPDVRLPDNTEIQPEIMVGLRRGLGLYAAVRPIKLYPGCPTPLKDVSRGIDFVILRENLEGLFASYGGGIQLDNQVAMDTIVITRSGTERIVDFAFRLAQKRSGRPRDGRKVVTCVDKANVFRSFAFFRKVFFEVAARYPEISAEANYVDAMSMYMVQSPADFDVLVMENEFGDILSDLGAGLVGGLGMAPSAEVGDQYGLFQPSHGTAPQLAGKNVANPLAMILSAAMMFEWLGDRHQDARAQEAARRIENAVQKLLADGRSLPRDLGGTASTTDVAAAVCALIEQD